MKANEKYWSPETETMPFEKLASGQMENLRSYIEHAYNKSPYYHRVMENKKIKPDDFQELEDYYKEFPFIDKNILIEKKSIVEKFQSILQVQMIFVRQLLCDGQGSL